MHLSALNALISEVRRHVARGDLFLFGSSSLLASFPRDPPSEIGVELTLDADFFLSPDDETLRAELNASFGRNEAYHIATGFYGDFVDLRLSESFPKGWRNRLVPVPGFAGVFALEPVDMAVTKIAATARSRLDCRLGRGGTDRGLKDINTIVALLRSGRLDRDALERRLIGMDYEPPLTVECAGVLRRILAHVTEHL